MDSKSLRKLQFLFHIFRVFNDANFCRLRAGGGKANVSGAKKMRTRERTTRAIPAPEANAELQVNIDVSETVF